MLASYDIKIEISKKTGILIDKLNFQTLREYCLLRQPIGSVITEIENELTEQHRGNLKIFEETSLNKAIEQQIIQDITEQDKDKLAISKLQSQKTEYLSQLEIIKTSTNPKEPMAKEKLLSELAKCEQEILSFNMRNRDRELRSTGQSSGNQRLSIKNLVALNQEIAVKQKQLGDIQASLLEDAKRISFSSYLEQLEIKTSNNGLVPENEALLSIISAIKKLLMVEDNLKDAQINHEKIMVDRKICADIAQTKHDKIQQALKKSPNNRAAAGLDDREIIKIFGAKAKQLMHQNETLKASLTNKILVISLSFLAVLALGTVLLINGLAFGIWLPILLSIPTTALLITGIWTAVSYAFICNTLSYNDEEINEYNDLLADLSEQLPQLITARIEYDRQISKLKDDITALENDFKTIYAHALAIAPSYERPLTVAPISTSPSYASNLFTLYHPSAPPASEVVAVPINVNRCE